MKKKLLFVINTLSRAGAEMAFLALLEKMESMPEYADCEISVFVLMGQGELVTQLPPSVRLCNRTYRTASVLSRQGVRAMKKTLLRAMFHRGTVLRLFPYLAENFCAMAHAHRILPDKLLWRVLSDGSSVQKEQYDLAVAFLEGGSAYYTADHVNAKKKAAFIHIDYLQAGYTRKLDRDCYLKFDAIFPIGENVRKTFLSVYPECAGKTSIFHNIINQKEILRKAELPGGFTDDFPGIRILTVGRLTKQKAYPVAVEAMRLLKQEAVCARWYVLGDGEERENLKKQIAAADLSEDFILAGAVDNPYPYYAQTDLYVHATAFEGKSIAISEAQTLGCAIIASESSREQITDGTDGLLCVLTPQAVKDAVLTLIREKDKRNALGREAAKRTVVYEEDMKLLSDLLFDETA